MNSLSFENIDGAARAGSFIQALKCEEVHLPKYQAITEARECISRLIGEVDNQKRLHLTLGYLPLAELGE